MHAVFTTAMIVEVVFGLAFLLFPAALLGRMGMALSPAAEALARLFGSAILSLAVLLWLVRRSRSAPFQRGVGISLLVYYLLSGGVFALALRGGLVNTTAWGALILHSFLAGWLGLALTKRRR